MKNKIKGFIFGIALFAFGGLILLVERKTDSSVSGLIGRLYCGEKYLQPVSQAANGMCGFNMDMMVGMLCFLFILIGLIISLVGLLRIKVQRKNK